MRVKKGRSVGATLRNTSREDSMRSVARARVMVSILTLHLPMDAEKST
jgi:hypothetical protein